MYRLHVAKKRGFFDLGIHMLQAMRWNGGDERSPERDQFEQN